MGFGVWGLGIGDWSQSPIPNPQSPIPNPQSPIPNNYNNSNNYPIKSILSITKIKKGEFIAICSNNELITFSDK